ncbi:MAG TPA: CRISPR-associated endonuclease Cas2 [Chloroflexi bacterium]|jgi:CRISPR-associated protein Cas2|nr:CRISPR-associated endonuclease Cas2 [Chloroflexota bacterium]
MGRCLVVYDISHDRTRTRVADLCLDYGLDRIQYSAFLGTLARTHQEELMLAIRRLLRRHGGNVQLYPLCAKDWAERQVIDLPPRGEAQSITARSKGNASDEDVDHHL